MKTPFLLAAAALCLAVPASARAQQAPANPVTAVIKELFDRQSQFMIDAAKEMPAEKYGYQPTAPQMTFGKIVSHVIGANAAVCRMIADTPAPPTMRAADTDPKEKLVSTLQASFEFCAQALPKLQDSKMGDPITFFGNEKTTRARAALELVADLADHYSQMASYLRLNNLVPPSAQPKK